MKAQSDRNSIQGEINTLRTRENSLHKKMANLAKKIKQQGYINYGYRIDEYVELNKALRETKIKEAELVYIRNIL